MKVTKEELAAMKKDLVTKFKKSRKGFRKGGGGDITDVEDQYSFSKYLKGMVTNDWTDAKEERKIFKKAIEQDDEHKGGVLVPEQTSKEVIELLQAKAKVRSMPGVQTLDMKTDKMTIGRLESGPQISWGGELETIDEDDSMRFGEVSLELNKCVIIYPLSREILMNAGPNVDRLVKDEMAKALALDEDEKMLEGKGGKQPLGIYRHPLVNNTDLSGTISFDDITSAMYQVEKNELEVNGWIGNPRTRQSLRSQKDGDGRWIISDPNKAGVMVPQLYGNEAHWTTKVPIDNRPGSNESYLIGADWGQLYIGQKPQIRVESSTEGGDAFTKDEVLIKMVRYVDIALRHPEGFVVIKGITT